MVLHPVLPRWVWPEITVEDTHCGYEYDLETGRREKTRTFLLAKTMHGFGHSRGCMDWKHVEGNMLINLKIQELVDNEIKDLIGIFYVHRYNEIGSIGVINPLPQGKDS